MGTAELSEALRVVIALAAIGIDAYGLWQVMLTRRALIAAGANGPRSIIVADKLRGALVRLLFAVLLILSGSILLMMPRGSGSDTLVEIVRWGWVVGAVSLAGSGISAELNRRRLLALLEEMA